MILLQIVKVGVGTHLVKSHEYVHNKSVPVQKNKDS